MEPNDQRAFYLGRYNCVERLGIGPLGETFRAKIYGVAGFEKQFAVKRLHAALCVDEALVNRIVDAASVYAALDDARIAKVHEVNAQGAQYYLSVDLVRGIDLGRLLELMRGRGERLALDSALLVALDLAEALEHAHARKDLLPNGVLHLGLAPQTVMLTFEGDVRMLDVGLVAPLIKPGWAQDDALVLTLAYLAPEVLRGGPVDARADVFSLGAILHELVTGNRAFAGTTAAELRRTTEAGPPEASAADERLKALLQRSLAAAPEGRFPTVSAMREALVPILGSRVTRARTDLAAVVRRLGRPLSRTGSFPVVAIPAAAPPPAPATTGPALGNWAPPVPKMPPLPVSAPRSSANGPAAPASPREAAPDAAALASDDAPTAPKPRVREETPVVGVDPEIDIIEDRKVEPAAPAPPQARDIQDTRQLPALVPEGPKAGEPSAPSGPRLVPRAAGDRRRSLLVGAALLATGLLIAGVFFWPRSPESEAPPRAPTIQPPATPAPNPPVTPAAPTPDPTAPTAAAPGSTPPGKAPAPAPSANAPGAAAPTTKSTSAETTPPKVTSPPTAGATEATQIATTPPGAAVFVDGEPRGVSPATLQLAAGDHPLVLLADGYQMQRATVHAGHPLDAVLVLAALPGGVNGAAGLKVRCHSSMRIFVDGADTGRMCPNEQRISVAPGTHKIGLFSPITGELHELDADIKDDGDHSTRIYSKY